MTGRSGARLLDHLAGIYPIVDDSPGRRHDLRASFEGALAGGAHVVQLRFKHTRDRDALDLTRHAVSRAHAHDALVIVNDRLDLACLAGADGVHLGDGDLPPELVPPDLRRHLLVGFSTHTLDQVIASRARPIDYIGFGPVFVTSSKTSDHDPRGPGLLALAVDEASVPVVAIGGIDAKNLPDVVRSGATAAAVISAVSEADDPSDATRTLRACFDRSASAPWTGPRTRDD